MDRHARVHMLYTVGLLAVSLALLGCPKRPEVAQAGPGAIGPSPATPPAVAAKLAAPEVPVTRATPPAETAVKPSPAATVAVPPSLKDIFFNFDDATIRDDQTVVLENDFEWLKAHPRVNVRIEGNCDERGTAEYNLALGERRAETMKASLVAEGIPADRVSTISYGRERPFVLGHDEDAWKWNRRDHLVLAR